MKQLAGSAAAAVSAASAGGEDFRKSYMELDRLESPNLRERYEYLYDRGDELKRAISQPNPNYSDDDDGWDGRGPRMLSTRQLQLRSRLASVKKDILGMFVGAIREINTCLVIIRPTPLATRTNNQTRMVRALFYQEMQRLDDLCWRFKEEGQMGINQAQNELIALCVYMDSMEEKLQYIETFLQKYLETPWYWIRDREHILRDLDDIFFCVTPLESVELSPSPSPLLAMCPKIDVPREVFGLIYGYL